MVVVKQNGSWRIDLEESHVEYLSKSYIVLFVIAFLIPAILGILSGFDIAALMITTCVICLGMCYVGLTIFHITGNTPTKPAYRINLSYRKTIKRSKTIPKTTSEADRTAICNTVREFEGVALKYESDLIRLEQIARGCK